MPAESEINNVVKIPAFSLPLAKPPVGFKGNGRLFPNVRDLLNLTGVSLINVVWLTESVTAPANISGTVCIVDHFGIGDLAHKESIFENRRINVNKLRQRFIGVEVQIGGYGEKYEGVNRVINVAEQRAKAVFVTTNLNGEQIMERYGMRTVDRLAHLCKIVKFKHNDSLRK